MLKLQVIIGSTRQGRQADAVVRWALPVARSLGHFEIETLDLRDWPLPFFQETLASLGDPRNPTYSDPLVKRWNEKIKEGDAFLIVTAEYNHGPPGVLKNAIDSVFVSFGFRHKPVAFIGYSGGVGAGVRAVEHLNQIMLEAEAVPVRTQTLVPFVTNAFDAEGKPTNPALEVGYTVMLEDLAWLAKPLKAARAEGEPPPPTLRIRAAMAKK
jgi:NAD(P)H-dependent FMN reductase